MNFMNTRRSFIIMLAGTTLAGFADAKGLPSKKGESMHGLIGKLIAIEGKRGELSAILLEGLRDMPGNLSYVVANDPSDENALWITEVWTDGEAHKASLTMDSVQSAIQKGRPLIAGMEQIAVTQPIGGHGI